MNPRVDVEEGAPPQYQALQMEPPAAPRAPGGPDEKQWENRIVQQYPKTSYVVSQANSHFLENLTLPAAIILSNYLYGELMKRVKDAKDGQQFDWVGAGLIAFNFLYVSAHLMRAGFNVLKAVYNNKHQLKAALTANNQRVDQTVLEAVDAMYSNRILNMSHLLDFSAFVGVNAAAMFFTQEQFQSGSGAIWFTASAFAAGQWLRGHNGKAVYKTFTNEDYNEALASNVAKYSVRAGLVVSAAGGAALAFLNHLIVKELNSGGHNPHNLPNIVAQAVVAAGIALGCASRGFLGADALEAAIETKLPGVRMNLKPHFFARRDVNNIALASFVTSFAAAMTVSFNLHPGAAYQLLPRLFAAMGLSAAAHYASQKYAQYLDAVSNRAANSVERVQPQAQVEHEDGRREGICGFRVCC